MSDADDFGFLGGGAARPVAHLMDRAEVARALNVLAADGLREGETFELRILGAYPLSGRFVSVEAAVDALAAHAAAVEVWAGGQHRGMAGAYFTPNPLTLPPSSCLEGGESATDGDVSRRRWFLLDVDPEREKVDDGTGKLVCPLVFDSAASGSGFDTAVVDAITKLTSFVSFKTVWLTAKDNVATTTLDESKFFVRGVPVSYEKPLPAGCATAPAIDDLLPTGGDGTYDSFNNVCPKTVLTFTLVLKNDVVAATCTDQVFSFTIVVVGDGKVEADSRIVTVRVPGDKTLCK